MSKTKTKEITTAYWNIRKHHMGPIEILKLPQANCRGVEVDETSNWFRDQCWFFSERKNQGRRRFTRLCQNWNMCADLVLMLGVKKELSAKQSIKRICSYFFFHVSDPEAPFISQTGAVS